MSSKKTKLKEEDLLETFDLLWSQLKEDREAIMAQFKDLSDITKGNAGQLAVNGDVLAKFGDLLIKNTSQVLELMKALQKQKEKDDTLSPEDWERISKEITSGEKVND